MPENENLTLLDKRISDLEASFAEMKDKLEEIEDLVMVEQAGVVEIKNMIEEVKTTSPEAAIALPSFEERLKKIENEIASALEGKGMPVGGLPSVEEEKISNRINELENKIVQAERIPVGTVVNEKGLGELNTKIQSIERNIDEITAELRTRRIEEPVLSKGIGERLPESDTGRVFNSISILSKEVDKSKSEMAEMTAEISALAKKIEESSLASSSTIYSAIRPFKEKIENLEAQYYKLSEQMKYMKPEDFERAMEKIGAMAVSIEDRYRKELEELKVTINRIVNELRTSSVVDREVNELLEKIVFLESRLKVVEKNVDETVGSKPVILE